MTLLNGIVNHVHLDGNLMTTILDLPHNKLFLFSVVLGKRIWDQLAADAVKYYLQIKTGSLV